MVLLLASRFGCARRLYYSDGWLYFCDECSDLSTEKLGVQILLEDIVVKELAVTPEGVEYTLDGDGDFGGHYGDNYKLCFKNNQKKDSRAKIEVSVLL